MQQCRFSGSICGGTAPVCRVSRSRHHRSPRSSQPASTTEHRSADAQPAPVQITDPASQLQAGSLLHGKHAQYGDVYVELLEPWDGATQSALAVWQGCTWHITQSSQQGIIMHPAGHSFALANKSLSKVPGLSAALVKLQQYQEQQSASTEGPYSSTVILEQPSIIDSLSGLRQRVGENPGPWVRGTGPQDPPPQGAAYQVLCAGELLALMAGHRGLAMVQVYLAPSLLTGDSSSGSLQLRQPIFNPYVLTLLKEAVTHPELGLVPSTIAGGLGVTALVFADKQPFRAWAQHLASFGAQAALVADSPYYKLLIGRMMGYSEQNIHHHIKTVHGLGNPSQQVINAVDKELSRLSSKRPTLPWNRNARGKVKKL